MASIKKLFRKPRFLKKKSAPVPATDISQTAEVVQDAAAQNAAPQKRKLLSRFKIFRRRKKNAPVQNTESGQTAVPAKRKIFRKPKFIKKPRFVQRTQMFVTRKRKQLVTKTKKMPKQLGQKAKQRFEASWVFRKYRVPVENSKWFKKLKPKVMKPFNDRKRRKFELQQKLDEIRKAPKERAYQEGRFTGLIKEANELKTPFRRLHDLNEINRRLSEYIAKETKKASVQPPEPGKADKFIPASFKKMTPQARDAQEVAEHLFKLRCMKYDLDVITSKIAAEHAEEIARDPNYAFALGPDHVNRSFAYAAAKVIRRLPRTPSRSARRGKSENPKP